jgi:tetratricopeptide (TPR) repeat protein
MYIVGADTCLAGLKAASDETRRSQQPFVVTQLVGGVSAAIAATAQYEGLLRNADPNWRSNFEETLQDFIVRGISTVETFSAYAAVTPSRTKRLETMKRAAEKFPEDGEVWLGLGLANLDLENYEEAVRNLNRARDLLPAARRPQIDRFIQQATTPSTR